MVRIYVLEGRGVDLGGEGDGSDEVRDFSCVGIRCGLADVCVVEEVEEVEEGRMVSASVVYEHASPFQIHITVTLTVVTVVTTGSVVVG